MVESKQLKSSFNFSLLRVFVLMTKAEEKSASQR